jgi:hypothetical protein
MEAPGVDSAHAAHRHRHPRSRAKHPWVQLLALLGASLLGVVEVGERTAIAKAERAVVDQDRGGNQGARQGATAGLVRSRDEPGAERAVELEEARGLALASRSPAVGALRGCRSGPAASR